MVGGTSFDMVVGTQLLKTAKPPCISFLIQSLFSFPEVEFCAAFSIPFCTSISPSVTSHVRPEEVSKLGGASPHWYIQERALIGGFIEWCWLVPDISNLQQTSHWKTEIKMEHLTEDPYRSFWVLACLLFLSQLQQHGLQRKMVLRCQEKQRQLEKAVASKTAVKFHICAFWSLYSTLFLRRDLSCVLRCKLRACWFAWNNFVNFYPGRVPVVFLCLSCICYRFFFRALGSVWIC